MGPSGVQVRRTTSGWVAAVVVAALAITGLAVPRAGADDANPWLDRRVVSVAHAGGEDEAPHSSMFAYKRSAALGINVLEGDVRLSADGVLVVHHDATVDATTDGTGLVRDKTYDELFALDHGYKFTPDRWSCGNCPEEDYIYRGVRTGDKAPPPGAVADDFTIPRVRDLFETFPGMIFDLEIKESGPEAQAAADELIALIREYDAVDRTIVVSFDTPTMDYVVEQFPEGITSPGLQQLTAWFLGDKGPMPEHKILQVPPTFSGITVVTPEMVDAAHAAGLAVWVWMDSKAQESDEFYASLIDMGVDGILASRPSVLVDVIDDADLRWDPPTTTTTTTSTPSSTTSVADDTEVPVVTTAAPGSAADPRLPSPGSVAARAATPVAATPRLAG